jgi:hypothetical protein
MHWKKKDVLTPFIKLLQKLKINGNKFDKPLKFEDIRKVVKKNIWKLALEELEKKSTFFYKVRKQVMLYYWFGSSLKQKKCNYFMAMNAENIFELFMEENFPRENKAFITKGI